jgi:ribosomal protein L7/L12
MRMPSPAGPLPADVVEALQKGQLLEAIKRLRAATHVGLAEAKQRIEAHGNAVEVSDGFSGFDSAAGVGLPEPVVLALREGNKIEAIRLLRQHTGIGLKAAYDRVNAANIAPEIAGTGRDGLAPGEVPRGRGGSGWIVVLVVLAVLAYWYFRDPG